MVAVAWLGAACALGPVLGRFIGGPDLMRNFLREKPMNESYLLCPVGSCVHDVWVSPQDPDASLSQMVSHLRAAHPGGDEMDLLARVLVEER